MSIGGQVGESTRVSVHRSLATDTLTAAQYTQAFTYDTLDRLSSSTSTGAAGGSAGSYSYGDSAHPHAATASAPSAPVVAPATAAR